VAGEPAGNIVHMLMVLGAAHNDLELTDLDRLSAGTDLLVRELSAMAAGPGSAPDSPVAGWVLLSTCNRLEIYLDADRFHDAIDEVIDAVALASGMASAEVGELLTVRVGSPVAAHLFSVASGLESMVVGEAEISGQVARALREAQDRGAVTPLLHALFHGAARTAKKVASTTELGDAGRSVASVALDVALRTTDLAPAAATAVVIGTGAYARVVVAALRARGCTDVRVYSPSGRAVEFAASHDLVAVAGDGLPAALAAADLVVSCSGTTGGALSVELLEPAMAGRDTPLPIIDLALRPDVPVAVRELPGSWVVDLHTVAAHADPAHAGAFASAQDMVLDAVAGFEDELAIRELDPAVVALRSHVSGAVDREMARLRAKYDQGVADDMALALHRVTQSLLHNPTMRARELARSGDGEDYLNALHTLFGIEIPRR